MKFLKIASLVLALCAALPAAAHTDEYLDGQPTPNGGQMRMAGAYHFELLVKGSEMTVWITDHGGNKVSAQGASGTATVLSGKAKGLVKLQAAGDNMLKGSGQFETSPDMKVAVSITLPGKNPEQARFTPLKKAAAAVAPTHRHH